MLKVTLICVGGLKEAHWRAACAEYLKRLSALCSVNIIELPESRLPSSPSQGDIARALELEGRAITAKIPAACRVCPLCAEGAPLDSPGLARRMAAADAGGICFIIGSSHGLADSIKKLGEPLSISPMTFPHQLARVMLLEQVYRGMCINAGSRYHK